ncbi:hypothetical protein ACFO25_02720 [Paenactinomyces guangxiensis]|uniref:Uncharacterized protein n=1 Tax=Paenactinomyces guangxiensis TaxID=1490290 RepID=A0A7W1WTA9_9BACL|nr:hypothetical protein [Paenactinomyces guangxiensis]MBA4495597.1 hypothetical protein [Paenactinomyces guangxiensis]MBH8592585.1 hypothetical protein [Paenactinomyces guangxiensis]
MSKKDHWTLTRAGKMGTNVSGGMIDGFLLLVWFAGRSEDLLTYKLGTFDTVVGLFLRSFLNEWLTYLALGLPIWVPP